MGRLSSEPVGPSPRVAIAAVGDPRSPRTWSGVPAGIIGGLRELGIEPHPLDLTLPAGLEQAMLLGAAARTRNRYDAQAAALTMHVRSLIARRAMRAGTVDGVIQIGTTFTLAPGIPYVTLEDMTVRQGGNAHPVFSRMSASALERWERRRAEIYAEARMCTVASHWAADSLREDYGIDGSYVAVVGFGANHLPVAPQRDRSSPRFLFVGIDWERKGGPQVLRAFSRVREVHPQAILDVVGGHPALREPGVNAHGVLDRARDRDGELMLELFARATCFVMPSLIEPFGIAYVEAASAGVASIASSVGGPRDVIGADGGLVVEPDDEDGLVRAMLRVADPATAQRMGDAARKRSALYTWTRVAERLLRALALQAPDRRELAEFL